MNDDYIEPVLHKSVLTHEECDELVKQADGKLLPSVIGGKRHIKNIRNSYSACLTFNFTPVVDKLKYITYKLTGYPCINYEDIQITRYLKGGYYRPHQDAVFNENSIRCKTIIVCLNDDYEGGETNFPVLNKRFKMEKGDILVFHTLNTFQKPTPKSLHEGCEITKGTKWIATIWIHPKPLVHDIYRYIKYNSS